MTHEQKQRIIEILEQHGAMIGNSTEEANELIKAVKFIKCRTIDLTVDERIKIELAELCQHINYEPTETNNLKRYPEIVAQRDAVVKVIFNNYSGYGNLYHIIADFFGKDRTAINAQEKRAQNRLETKDAMFMRYYNQLITYNLLKQVA